MMVAAQAVKKAKDALEKMDHMRVGYDRVVGTPAENKVERCVIPFDPTNPLALAGQEPIRAEEGEQLPSWDEAKKNFDRAHAVIDHYTRLYPALIALRDDSQLDAVSQAGVSSQEPADNLAAMRVVHDALNDTMKNIDKTYGLLNDPESEFALELQPIQEQLFLFDPFWKDPFRQLVARNAVKEHGDVEFWKTIGVSTAGLALFVVAEFSSGGLATFFFAAAAAGGIAQAAASWDKYFTLKAAAGTNLSAESALISQDRASDQLVTAALDTVMAFVNVYIAAKGSIKALGAAETVSKAEAKLAEVAEKEGVRAAEEDLGAGRGVLQIDEAGRCKICHSPCQFELEWCGKMINRADEMGNKLLLGYVENLQEQVRTFESELLRDPSSEARLMPGLKRISGEVSDAYRLIVENQARDVPAINELIERSSSKSGLFDDPALLDRAAGVELAQTGTAYHEFVLMELLEEMPAGTLYTEDTAAEFFEELGVDPPARPSSGVDIYVINRPAKVITVADLTNIAGNEKHVAKLAGDVEKVARAISGTGWQVQSFGELSYVGMSQQEAAKATAHSIAPFAVP